MSWNSAPSLTIVDSYHIFETSFPCTIHVAGFNRDGYNRQGYDRLGYNRYGYNVSGYSRYGYDNEGWSKENEQDLSGRYDAYGFDKNCLDRRGE